MLDTVLLVGKDGADAAFLGVASVTAVGVELALSLLATDVQVLGLDGVQEVLIELSHGLGDVFLILLVAILIDDVFDILRVLVAITLGVDLPVSSGGVVNLGGLTSHGEVVTDGGVDLSVSGGSGQNSHSDSSSLHLLFLKKIIIISTHFTPFVVKITTN